MDLIDLSGAAFSLRVALMVPGHSISVAAGGRLVLGTGPDTLVIDNPGDSAITLTSDDVLF